MSAIPIIGDNFLQIYENGTHGSNDWKYYGNTLMYSFETIISGSGMEGLVFFDSTMFEDSVYESLKDEVQAVATYAYAQPGWTQGDIANYFRNYLKDIANRGVIRDWTCYKFCFENAHLYTPGLSPTTCFIEYPQGTCRSLQTAGAPNSSYSATIVRMKDVGQWPTLQIL